MRALLEGLAAKRLGRHTGQVAQGYCEACLPTKVLLSSPSPVLRRLLKYTRGEEDRQAHVPEIPEVQG